MSVNFPDVRMIRGLYQAEFEPPFVAGTECAGVVVQVGVDVQDLASGNRVLRVVGAFATEVDALPLMRPWPSTTAGRGSRRTASARARR
jgi:NADPH2:quinone reductase